MKGHNVVDGGAVSVRSPLFSERKYRRTAPSDEKGETATLRETKPRRLGTARPGLRWFLIPHWSASMKTALVATAAALLLAGVWSVPSFAQHYDDEDHGGSYGHHYDQQSGKQDEQDGDQSRERDRSRDMGSTMNDRSRDMGRRGGARFQFSKGDAHIDIRCPQNETLQNCVDAASRLIDKVHSLEPTSAGQASPTK